MEIEKTLISSGVLRKVFFRSFFLQSLWNFKGMQNAGFLYVIKPALDFLYPVTDERKSAYLRHLDFFNTHPYYASYIIGAVCAAEEKYASTGSLPALRQIVDTKKILGGPIAAFGDSKIWGTLRPFAAVIGVFFIILFSKNINLMWVGPACAFIFYSAVHIYIRFCGLRDGYKRENTVFDTLFTGKLQKSFAYMRIAAIVMAAFLLLRGFLGAGSSVMLKTVYPVVFIVVVLFIRKISATALFYAVLVLGGLIARYCH
ncbi:MAG: PTS system mannose/fructose/sorbose family transporter subunit IID [Elusimicrobiota bacterium]|nr:PTS system mannose/fructose/sorbose family transporter subunit IID [Elusimicrobiota bacterium]